ncbi:BofC C-terminal domain-containing protein [Syntrophomonas wolfei]|uniref:Bypass of forespore C C-terminal domain-containing protein n=1 Tax=Syntrophomonas wolfei TaxID=863 RepID=A0A354Z0W3_9FIRM|nr:hypothetical protein [Syntrophomonas wolfei]HBK54102.1 hypothetical protein [Syntrophomonas wolfei]
MKRTFTGITLLGILIMVFLSGYFIGSHKVLEVRQKPVLGIDDKSKIEEQRINEKSQIVMEKEYKRCQHVVISDFEPKEQLLGKSYSEISRIYSPQNGFTVSLQDDTLCIHQIIDDWCPLDKEKYRLKEYQGKLAVYQGPDEDNEVLLRVTSISMETLPAEIQSAIREGKYEFNNEELLNDALENLDEY